MITRNIHVISVEYIRIQTLVLGQGKASITQEHASVVVETVTKTSTTTRFSGIQRFSSDATKVTAKGTGLSKAFRGKTATFTVDASGAGEWVICVCCTHQFVFNKLHPHIAGCRCSELFDRITNALLTIRNCTKLPHR